VVVTVAVRVLLAAGVWRLLRVLFTPGWRLLVPLGVTLVTPALLPSSAWYRQSITGLAAAAALVWALDAHVRWHEEGRWRHVGAAVAATAVGLGCYEKAALVPVLLLGVSVAVFGGGTASGGGTGSGADAERSRGWRAGLVPVVATGLLVAVFVLVYRLGPYDQGTEVPLRPGALLELTGRALETLLPGLLGGPWTWRYPQPYYGMADPAAATVTASFVVVGLGLLLALVRRPGQVFRAVFLAALWTFSSIGLVAVGRLSRAGMTLAEDYRLFADVSVALILCAALAVLPWRVGALGAAAPSAWWTAAGRRLTGLAVRGRHLPLRAAAQTIGVVALLAVLAGSAVSTERFARAWWQNPAGAWTERMRTGLELASARPRLVPRTVPPEIVPGWVQPDFLDAPLVALVRPDARFHDANGPQLTLDPTGRPVQAQLLRLGGTPPATLCTATLQPGAREPARAAFGTPVPLRPRRLGPPRPARHGQHDDRRGRRDAGRRGGTGAPVVEGRALPGAAHGALPRARRHDGLGGAGLQP
jgi:hypothetical protein